MNELIELINSVKIATEYNEIELFGDKKSFDDLAASGFPLGDFKCIEAQFDESKIIIVPCEPKPIKLYFESNDR